jgi:hypothetical protein
MISPFNTPVETGMRALVLLAQHAPHTLDLNRLVLLDHGLLHSADFGGPESLYPSLPLRTGEFGIKRRDIELGLQVMLRAGLVELVTQDSGIYYRASEEASNFLGMLESNYIVTLADRASWVVANLGSMNTDDELRDRMTQAVGHWSSEFSRSVFPTDSSVIW